MNIRFRYYILSAYLLFISILFFLPGSAFPKNNWLTKIHFDKFVHIGIFFLLGVLVIWSFRIKRKEHIIISFITLAVYGILIEVIQDQLVINRSFDVWDWVADIVGACLAIIYWYIYKKNRPL